MNSEWPDVKLFEAVCQDNLHAFDMLFKRHWETVYKSVYNYTHDKERAVDITHDIFLNIWRKRNVLDIKSFRNYVIAAGIYQGIRERQIKNLRIVEYVDEYAAVENAIFQRSQLAYNNAGEEKIKLQELNEKINRSLSLLPKRCREIYILSRDKNMTISEIASHFGISKRTVENQLTTALKHLRNLIRYSAFISFFILML